MSILFVTPAYGGMVTLAFHRSILALQENLLKNDVPHDWLTTANESLVTRARNTSTATYLATDYQRMMFIDADIEFVPEDVIKLWNMDADVAVAAYPLKREPAPPLSAWVDGKLIKDFDGLPNPCVVDYAGTGFMLIKRSVFERLREAHPRIAHEEGGVGRCWAFFDTGVEDGIYLSEDYWFCKRWRELGGDIFMDPTIRLKHWGAKAYGD